VSCFKFSSKEIRLNYCEKIEISICFLLFPIVTAFTIERYFAICHPFLAHKMSKLSRAVKYIFLIWILSISFAIPQALQTGLVVQDDKSWCTVVGERVLIEHSFELATLFFFFAPMSLITVLYILIGIKLRSSTIITKENGGSVHRKQNSSLTANIHQSHSTCQSSKRVIKMLGKLKNFLIIIENF
jgi:neuromedin U receptor 1